MSRLEAYPHFAEILLLFMNRNMQIPTEEECFRLMKEHHMKPNIVDHSIQVKNVALAITDNLKEGVIINRKLVLAAALLHDIAKTRSIERQEPHHDRVGAEILRDMGLHEIGDICESHVYMDDFNEDGPLEEREIVHYADKRVMHDRVVSVEERIEDLVERYGNTQELKDYIRKNREFVDRLERKVRRHMNTEIETALTGL